MEKHFIMWCKTYETYLNKLWAMFENSIQKNLGLAKDAKYEDFVLFVYQTSDGYISEYA